MVFERGVQEELHDDWEKENFMPIFKQGKKEGFGKYRLLSFGSVYKRIMEQIHFYMYERQGGNLE